MENTNVAASFTDADTVQLRFELGRITDAVATDQVPDLAQSDEGWIWQNGWVGRVQLSGEAFMPLDTYTASAIDPLFDAPGGETTDRVAAVDQLAKWSVTVNGVEVGIDDMSRKSNILDTATVGWGVYEFRTLQNVFLDLDTPLNVGDDIVIRFDDQAFEAITVTYDPSDVISEAIHVNLTGFDPDDVHKVAYLSSWNGWSHEQDQAVAQGYDGPLDFDVVNSQTGEVVLSGATTLGTPVAQATDFDRNYSLTDVWEMDLSALDQVGTYHIEVDGVGRSNSFDVADTVWGDVFETSFSGFYHQRSGIALEAEYTDWTRDRALHPDDGNVTVYATTLEITQTDESYDQSQPDQFGPLVAAATDEILDDAWGGWHDAGDWDRRTQHLEASRQLTDLVEIAPEWSESMQAQIPENTNKLPDLLDEALWNLEFYARLQTAEGGVRGGIEGDDYRGYGANSAEEVHTLYAYAPDTWTTWEFAASAAKMSRVIEPYDAQAATTWLQRAEAAMNWAETRVPSDIDITQATSRNLAAAELYAATGDATWHDLFLDTSSYTVPDADLAWNEYQFEAAVTYSRMDPADVQTDVAARAFDALTAQADFLLDQGRTGGFGFIADPYAPYGWGITASQPNGSSDFMVALHDLTGDARYLAAIQGDVQYALGANPMNLAFMTGIDGVRSPEIILNADADSMGGTPPPGITLYGDYNIYDYGQHESYATMWNELFPNAYEAPVHESFNGYYLFVPSTEYTVQQGIADMTYVTGYLASQGGVVAEPPTIEGSAGDDTLQGSSAAETILGFAGDDTLDGAGGADLLNGGAGDDWLFGMAGDDILRGGNDDDVLMGGVGADVLDGGSGVDHVAYKSSNAAVTVDLMTGAGFGGHATGDTLSNIERVTGSNGFGDKLIGNAGDNLLRGNGGNDILRGEGGRDILIGGSGSDYAVYATSNAAVAVDLVTGIGVGGHAEGDTLSGIEKLSGSRFRDKLFGDTGDNLLRGNSGNDILRGEDGADILIGGSGSDYAVYATSDAAVMVDLATGTGVGGHAEGDRLMGIEKLSGSSGFGDTLSGDDRTNLLRGNGGNDTLNGRGGDDHLVGGSGDDTFIFDAGWGRDRVVDFNVTGNEILDFSSLNINAGQLLIDIRAGATILSFGQNTIELIGVTEDLMSDDFVF